MIAVSTRGAGRVWRVKILRSPEAKSLAPSAEEATADQGPDGKTCVCQLNPELVEVKMTLLSANTATSLTASAEHAIDCQFVTGAPVGFHVIPALVEV